MRRFNLRKLVTVITLVLVLVMVNWSIYEKEQLLKNGQVVYLELVPVDPRSLMQGDYMALRFAVAESIDHAFDYGSESFDGFAKLALDENRVGTFTGFVETPKYEEGSLTIQFRIRQNTVRIATNAYFFEEGTGPAFEEAKYGQFRVDSSGELLLVSLMDESLVLLDGSEK